MPAAPSAASARRRAPSADRDAPYVLSLVAVTPTAAIYSQVSRFISDFKSALAPVLDGVYMNFLEGGEALRHTRDAYSHENYRTLMELKAKYDPENRFCHSFNIQPAG